MIASSSVIEPMQCATTCTFGAPASRFTSATAAGQSYLTTSSTL
jgi:hypothetical protein